MSPQAELGLVDVVVVAERFDMLLHLHTLATGLKSSCHCWVIEIVMEGVSLVLVLSVQLVLEQGVHGVIEAQIEAI